jgi:uncharacterized cupredoxin-like copper-binding protein
LSRGHIEHNFVISGNGVNHSTKLIPPGSSDSMTLALAPGRYDFMCSVPGHAIVGMSGSFILN